MEDKLLIIDEISFATNFNIRKINEHLMLLKDTIAPFGGINIVFAGDLRQLEPISGKSIIF
jgi:PIF1-like helicase